MSRIHRSSLKDTLRYGGECSHLPAHHHIVNRHPPDASNQFIIRRPAEVSQEGVSISSLGGSTAHDATLVINGNGFGVHPDWGGAGHDSLYAAYNDFSSSLNAGNFAQDGQDPTNCNLSTASPMGGNKSQHFRKTHAIGANQGSVAHILSAYPGFDTGIICMRGWWRESISTPELGSDSCAKWLRHYLGDPDTDPNRNWYFGPGVFPNGWGTTNGFGNIYGHNGRYNGTHLGDVTHPQNVWRHTEVLEVIFGGVALGFGSADFFAHYIGNEQAMRRGSELPSNFITQQGSDANEHDRWLDNVSTTYDNSQGIKWGSHICHPQDDLSAYLDFLDVTVNYGLQAVQIGAASTRAACTGFFDCPPLTWNNTQIQCRVNRGNLSPTFYVYVRNSNFEWNETGFPIAA